MVKKAKVEPANLSVNQKAEIKKQILKEYPSLSLFSDDIDFLIDQYDKDKDYVKKLMKAKVPVEQTLPSGGDIDNKIKIVKKDTDEWHEIVAKMEKAREEMVKIDPPTATIEEIEDNTKSA